MNLKKDTAKHLHGIFFGGNWTSVNLKDTLSAISFTQATQQIAGNNSIVVLFYHSTYFLQAIIDVLDKKPLSTKDKESFETPPILNESDWQALQEGVWKKAQLAIAKIEQMGDTELHQYFGDKKYGSIYSNVHGIIEHLHYHLGQISILKNQGKSQGPK